MGCCSVTQRHTGVDEVGPDEIELLELPGDSLGVWSPGESRLQLSLRSSRDEKRLQKPREEVALWGRSKEELHHRLFSQPGITGWEGPAPHTYGEILHSSLVSLYDRYTKESSEHFLVLFSFHLLILSLDHSRQDFSYEGILPLSGLSLQTVSLDPDLPPSPHVFEISGPMMESKVFACASAADLREWIQRLEDGKSSAMTQPSAPAHSALSFLLPCDEPWKKEELKNYLMQAPIWQWEGSPIQHMGRPEYLSAVHVVHAHRQGPQERLLVLFPQDLLLLSVDKKRLNVKYEGRLARHSVRAVELSTSPGRQEFELTGELMDPLQVSCSHLEDHQTWMFKLQQPDRSGHSTLSHAPPLPPMMPKLHRSRKDRQQESFTGTDRCHINGRS